MKIYVYYHVRFHVGVASNDDELESEMERREKPERRGVKEGRGEE